MILITGATGLLGGHLIWHLLQEHEQVIALKRLNSDVENIKSIFQYYGNDADELFERIIWREADIENLDSLNAAFENVDYVYHCAAMVDLGKNSQRMIDVNVGGTKNVVDACLENKVKKLCFVSSIAALPNGNGMNPIDENTPFQENERSSIYGESKRLAENEISRGIKNGLKAVIVNPSVILGYSKNLTGSGELFKRVKAGLPFYTNGQTGYVAVDDVVRAMILLTKSEISGERFVISAGNYSHKNVLRWIADGYSKYRPFIGMGKTLILVSKVLEFLGKTFHFKPVIDSSSARISISKKLYSNQKFLKVFPEFEYSSLENTIQKICQFDGKSTKLEA